MRLWRCFGHVILDSDGQGADKRAGATKRFHPTAVQHVTRGSLILSNQSQRNNPYITAVTDLRFKLRNTSFVLLTVLDVCVCYMYILCNYIVPGIGESYNHNPSLDHIFHPTFMFAYVGCAYHNASLYVTMAAKTLHVERFFLVGGIVHLSFPEVLK